MLKIILDIKIRIFRTTESPKYQILAHELLPLALDLHKGLTAKLVHHLNNELSFTPWLPFVIKRISNKKGIICCEKTRKAYINYYSKLIEEYQPLSFEYTESNKKVTKKKGKKRSKNTYQPHELATIM